MGIDKGLLTSAPLWLLLTLLTIFAEDLYHWLTGEYLITLQQTLSYKLLFQISLALFFLSLLLVASHFRKQHKPAQQRKPQTLLKEPSMAEQDLVMKHLALREKKLLARYIEGDAKHLPLNPVDPTAKGLVKKQVLFIQAGSTVQDVSGLDAMAAFTINEWAWRYVKQYPKALAD